MDLDPSLEDELLGIFLAESQENLAAIEAGLVALEESPDDPDTLNTVFRAAHTLKGNAASVGYKRVTEFAHVLEDLLDRLRDQRIAVTSSIIEVLLRSTDVIRELIFADAPAGERGDPGRRGALGAHPSRATLRVDVRKLDHVLNLVGEIAVARHQLDGALARIDSDAGRNARDVHHESDRLHVELQESVLAARLVALGPTLQQYARVVRDAASSHGKQALFDVTGEDADVDLHTIELLRDPLTHMIRNALAHGIEPPDVRAAAGKDPVGRVSIAVHRDGTGLCIELSDDGAGIDGERVRARALALGLIEPAKPLNEAETVALIFRPGFSTAEEVSELSGRGVGMDVVNRNVDALRGAVDVRSRRGEGTTITIRLPLTVAIIAGFSFAAADQVFVLPLETVSECLELGTTHGSRATGMLDVRDGAVPYFRLRDLWKLGPPAPGARENVIIIEHAGRRAGLVVDELLGSGQVVIKPLGRVFDRVHGVSGSAITGGGRLALILDAPALLRQVSAHERGSSQWAI